MTEPIVRFQTTLWTQVLQARKGSPTERCQALEILIQRNWQPVYTYIRRAGWERSTAEDLTQDMMTRLLEEKFWASVQPGSGKFRTFLLACVKNLLADERDRQSTQKRSHLKTESLDFDRAEAELPGVSTLPPEEAFDQNWAFGILQRALSRLEREYVASGREIHFQVFQEAMQFKGSGERNMYSQLRQRHGLSEMQVTNFLHRSRDRLRALIHEEVEETCSDPETAREEIRVLHAIFG